MWHCERVHGACVCVCAHALDGEGSWVFAGTALHKNYFEEQEKKTQQKTRKNKTNMFCKHKIIHTQYIQSSGAVWTGR